MLAPCPATSSIHRLCLSSSVSGSIQSSPGAMIPLGNGSGSQKNYFYCLNLERFVSSVCWELFSKQGSYLKWCSGFLFVTKVAVNLLRTDSELFCHSALLWRATPELLWRATPTGEVGNWFLISPGHSAHCCVRMQLGNGGTKRASRTFWCLSGEWLLENALISSRIQMYYSTRTSMLFHKEVTCKHYSICMREKNLSHH